MNPPTWLDESGQPRPVRPCSRGGHDAPIYRLRLADVRRNGWSPFTPAAFVNWCGYQLAGLALLVLMVLMLPVALELSVAVAAIEITTGPTPAGRFEVLMFTSGDTGSAMMHSATYNNTSALDEIAQWIRHRTLAASTT